MKKIKVNLFPEEAAITLKGEKGWLVDGNFYPESVVRKMKIPKDVVVSNKSFKIMDEMSKMNYIVGDTVG